MRKGSLYPRLAFQNIKNNRKFYLPYILTGMGVSMMFYIMLFLTFNEGLKGSFGGRTLGTFLTMGSVIIAIFSVVLLFYTNSFLMKRRKMELGLYIVLGMEKRNLAGVQFFESFYVGLASIAGGLLLGLGFSRLSLSLLTKIGHVSTPLVFSLDMRALTLTLALFAAVYVLIYLYNLTVVGRAKPIELLKGGNVGEKEPKTKWFLTILGILALGGGYAIALLVESPITAVMLFFVAVLLVIAGTYLLFTTGSVTVLKGLRNNKGYYYQTRHFIGVSGMIYRMKQNAVGLANICILSTMVLVMISSTVSLNVATEDILDARYPSDITVYYHSPSDNIREKALGVIEEYAREQNVELTNLDYAVSLSKTLPYSGGSFHWYDSETDGSWEANTMFTAMSDAEYSRITGNETALSPGQALVYRSGEELPESFGLLGLSLKNTGPAEGLAPDEMEVYMDLYVRLVLSQADYDRLLAEISQHGEDETGELLELYIDVDLPEAKQLEFRDGLANELSEKTGGTQTLETGEVVKHNYSRMYADARASGAEDIYSMYGGLLFLGICLGLMFMMATILIIYYKQITEGYNDRDRFVIMRKVGLSDREIRGTIRSQILTVFFLPLVTAVIHICFAFSIITKLMSALNMTNVGLYAICTAATVGVFALFYLAVYAVTAREYYKIVS